MFLQDVIIYVCTVGVSLNKKVNLREMVVVVCPMYKLSLIIINVKDTIFLQEWKLIYNIIYS